jgi:large subunit ribosomal protein L31
VDGRLDASRAAVDVCGNCHPFYTGKQTIIDTAGQVERFQKRLERQVRS